MAEGQGLKKKIVKKSKNAVKKGIQDMLGVLDNVIAQTKEDDFKIELDVKTSSSFQGKKGQSGTRSKGVA